MRAHPGRGLTPHRSIGQPSSPNTPLGARSSSRRCATTTRGSPACGSWTRSERPSVQTPRYLSFSEAPARERLSARSCGMVVRYRWSRRARVASSRTTTNPSTRPSRCERTTIRCPPTFVLVHSASGSTSRATAITFGPWTWRAPGSAGSPRHRSTSLTRGGVSPHGSTPTGGPRSSASQILPGLSSSYPFRESSSSASPAGSSVCRPLPSRAIPRNSG